MMKKLKLNYKAHKVPVDQANGPNAETLHIDVPSTHTHPIMRHRVVTLLLLLLLATATALVTIIVLWTNPEHSPECSLEETAKKYCPSIAQPVSGRKIVVLGSSIAGKLAPALKRVLPEDTIITVAGGGVVTHQRVGTCSDRDMLYKHITDFLPIVDDIKPEFVVLHIGPSDSRPCLWNYRGHSNVTEGSLYGHSFEGLLQRWSDRGYRVVVVTPPYYLTSGRACDGDSWRCDCDYHRDHPTLPNNEITIEQLAPTMREVSAKFKNVELWDFLESNMANHDRSLYDDCTHMSSDGYLEFLPSLLEETLL